MSDDESREPTPEEQREAEALAHALERGAERDPLPEDALETAAMLRYSRDEGRLAPDRSAAILDELLARYPTPAPARVRVRLWRWLVPVAGLTSAAAVALLLLLPPSAPSAAALPAPPRALLEAQLGAAQGDPGSGRALTRAMTAYRSELYAALDARYTR